MALEEVGDRPGADAPRLVGSGRKAPEVANPGLGEIAFDLQKLRIVAPELLAGPVHEPGPVTGQVVRNPRPLAQLDDLRGGRVQEPERVAVGSQGIAERTSIAAIVLGAGRREAVSEPVPPVGGERHPAGRLGVSVDHHRNGPYPVPGATLQADRRGRGCKVLVPRSSQRLHHRRRSAI